MSFIAELQFLTNVDCCRTQQSFNFSYWAEQFYKAKRNTVLYIFRYVITHSRSNNQGEFAISAVVVDWLPEYQGGSVPGLERKFPLFVSLHDSVINVAVRRVRLVAIQRVNPAKYRHTCEFISDLYAARQLIEQKSEEIRGEKNSLRDSRQNLEKWNLIWRNCARPVSGKYLGRIWNVRF